MGRIRDIFAKNLRSKLIFTTVLVAVLTWLIISAYSVWVTSLALSDQVSREQIVELDVLSQRIISFLTGLEQDIFLLSNTQTLAQYLAARADDPASQETAQKQKFAEKEFLNFAQTRKIYDQIRFIDAEGNEIIRVNTSSGGVLSVVPEENLQNKADRYYFSDSIAIAPGEVFVSPLDLNIEQGQIEILPDGSNKPVIRYGTPVVFDGEVVGVIVTNVLAKNFLSLLENPDSPVYLVDKDGYYLYHQDEEKRWGRDLDTGITLLDDYSAETKQTLLSDEPGTFSSEGKFFAYRPVMASGSPNITWYLGKVQSQREAFQSVIDFLVYSVIVGAMALAVAVVAAVMISRSITRPVLDLNEAAARVAGGDFDTKIVPRTEDEIGALARSFNVMSGRVQKLMEERIQRRTYALEASAVVNRHISTVLDIDQLLENVVQQIQQVLGYYHVHIYLVDQKTEELVMREGSGDVGRQLKAKGHKLQPGQGIVGRVAQQGEPFLVENVDEIIGFYRNPLLPKTQAELAVPLRKGSVILGVLDMQSEQPDGFSQDDLMLMQSIADYVAVALENARLFREVQIAGEEARELSRQLTEKTWKKVSEQVQTTGFTYTKNGVIPASTDWLPAMGQAVRRNHLVKDVDKANGDDDEIETATVAVPLILRDEVIGVIGLERAAGHDWSEDELVTIQSITDQISLALDAARLSRETGLAAWRDRVVSETTAQVWSSDEVADVMKAAVAQLGERLKASEVVIQLGASQLQAEIEAEQE
ncbi:MAG: hypothetical protein B6I38_07430 [Anaerolineaceae bacterium 4572_5.1]|nr:MAG: hypothetical protein B6I38_07430 [Anaerolineaceae bacterium 4572_5.1]